MEAQIFSQIYKQSARNVNASHSTGKVQTERLWLIRLKSMHAFAFISIQN